MKTVGGSLLSHLSLSATTLCTCVKATRQDGEIFGFTDHDRNFTFDGVDYESVNAVSISAVTTSSGLNVDNLELTGFVDTVTESDIQAGVWDGAEVRIFEVNWANLALGSNRLKRGIVGDVSLKDNSLSIEVRGLIQYLQSPVGEATSKFCKADLFDIRCKVPETEGVWKFSSVSLTGFESNRSLAFASLGQADDFFTNGKMLGVTGDNAGIVREIKLHTAVSPGNTLELYEEMPYDVQIGDTFTIWAGCQKRYEEDCITKFANGINFRGFPWLPGPDAALQGPE